MKIILYIRNFKYQHDYFESTTRTHINSNDYLYRKPGFKCWYFISYTNSNSHTIWNSKS